MTKTKINKFKKIKNSDFKFDRHGKEYNNQNQTQLVLIFILC